MKYLTIKQGVPYFQKKGHLRRKLNSPIPAPGQEAGSVMEAEIQAILGELAPQTSRPAQWTLSDALKTYELESPEFTNLGDETKQDYGYKIKRLRNELGPVPVSQINSSKLLALRGAWNKKHGVKVANDLMMLMRFAMGPVIIDGAAFNRTDPFAHIKPIRRAGDKTEHAHPIWPDEVVEVVIAMAVDMRFYGVAKAVAVARYAGPRRSDLVKITRAHTTEKGIAFMTNKRGVPVAQRDNPRLMAWLEKLPTAQPLARWKTHGVSKNGNEYERRVVPMPPPAAPTLIFNTHNKPYTEDGLGQAVAKVVKKAFAEKKIDADHYTLHGLRHALGVELAHRGAPDAEGGAVLGHSSPNTFAIYRKQANRALLTDNAMGRLPAALEPVTEKVTEGNGAELLPFPIAKKS